MSPFLALSLNTWTFLSHHNILYPRKWVNESPTVEFFQLSHSSLTFVYWALPNRFGTSEFDCKRIIRISSIHVVWSFILLIPLCVIKILLYYLHMSIYIQALITFKYLFFLLFNIIITISSKTNLQASSLIIQWQNWPFLSRSFKE